MTSVAREIRKQRARQQADRYEVRRAVIAGEGMGAAFWVINHADRRIYSVNAGKCSCPDFAHRGGPCKHIALVEEFLGVDETVDEFDGPALAAEEADPRAEEIRAAVLEKARREREVLWP